MHTLERFNLLKMHTFMHQYVCSVSYIFLYLFWKPIIFLSKHKGRDDMVTTYREHLMERVEYNSESTRGCPYRYRSSPLRHVKR